MVKRPRPIRLPNLVPIRLSDELLAEIDAQAEKAGLTRADTMRQLIVLGLNALLK